VDDYRCVHLSTCDNAGIVFGYTDHQNFWVLIYSKAQQKQLLYQVSSGTWTQRRSASFSITGGNAFTMAIDYLGSGGNGSFDPNELLITSTAVHDDWSAGPWARGQAVGARQPEIATSTVAAITTRGGFVCCIVVDHTAWGPERNAGPRRRLTAYAPASQVVGPTRRDTETSEAISQGSV
jgi:hypothetical protein